MRRILNWYGKNKIAVKVFTKIWLAFFFMGSALAVFLNYILKCDTMSMVWWAFVLAVGGTAVSFINHYTGNFMEDAEEWKRQTQGDR